MWKYIGKRLLQMIPILIVVAILIFTLMYFVPGDPIQILLGDTATPVQIQETRERLGLDYPYTVRLKNFIVDLCHLDFGESYITGADVGRELIGRFPNTLILAFFCVAVSLVFGIPIGIHCALRADKLPDRIWLFITMLCSSMPSFWLALMLVLLFSLRLGLLPSNGIGGWEYFVLPIIANSIGSVAGIARQTRSSMLETIRSDFVTTARSKGLNEKAVILKHALPNALIPIITIAGGHFGFMLGGTTVIESVFSLPGIGSFMLAGINNRDYPVVQGGIIYIAFAFAIMMLIVDLVYAFVDPRIKAQYVSGRKK